MYSSPTQTTDIIDVLAIEAVEQGYALWFRVASGSMRPLLQIEDAALIQAIGIDEIEIGDIVAFTTEQGLVIHRIVCRKQGNAGSQLLQMGDGEIRPTWIARQAVIGKVIAVRRAQTIFDLQRSLARCWSKIVATLRYWRYSSGGSPLLSLIARSCTFTVYRIGCWSIATFCRSSQLEAKFDMKEGNVRDSYVAKKQNHPMERARSRNSAA